jgi:peroxiredoxin
MELSLKPFFSHFFKDKIWRILPDVDTGLLVVETRNADELKANFHILDGKKMAFISENLVFSQPWWIGIETFYNAKLYLHHYFHRQFSNHIGIYCYDVISNKMIWENATLVYDYSENGFIHAYHYKNPLERVVLDANTGKVSQFENNAKSLKNTLLSPLLFNTEDDKFAVIIQFIHKKTSFIAVHSTEYLEYDDKIFISFYTFESEQYNNYLLVCDLQGNLLLKITLDTGLKGVGSGAFFIINHQLVVVTEKQKLWIYEI